MNNSLDHFAYCRFDQSNIVLWIEDSSGGGYRKSSGKDKYLFVSEDRRLNKHMLRSNIVDKARNTTYLPIFSLSDLMMVNFVSWSSSLVLSHYSDLSSCNVELFVWYTVHEIPLYDRLLIILKQNAHFFTKAL